MQLLSEDLESTMSLLAFTAFSEEYMNILSKACLDRTYRKASAFQFGIQANMGDKMAHGYLRPCLLQVQGGCIFTGCVAVDMPCAWGEGGW